MGTVGDLINKIQWRKEAQDMFVETVRILDLPTAVIPTPGGKAVWDANTLKTLKLYNVTLTDEAVMTWSEKQFVPCRVEVAVKFSVSSSCFGSALMIHDGLMYDAQYKCLVARTSSFEKSIAVLLHAVSITECLTVEGIRLSNVRLNEQLDDAHTQLASNLTKLANVLKNSPRFATHIDADMK